MKKIMVGMAVLLCLVGMGNVEASNQKKASLTAATSVCFRRAVWGMTSEQVIKTETLELLDKEKFSAEGIKGNVIFFGPITLCKEKVLVGYVFVNNQLFGGGYFFDPQDKELHQKVYRIFLNKYGEPIYEREGQTISYTWKNNGLAIVLRKDYSENESCAMVFYMSIKYLFNQMGQSF